MAPINGEVVGKRGGVQGDESRKIEVGGDSSLLKERPGGFGLEGADGALEVEPGDRPGVRRPESDPTGRRVSGMLTWRFWSKGPEAEASSRRASPAMDHWSRERISLIWPS